MPIYDYQCSDCGTTSEFFVQSINSDSIKCPKCGTANMEKLFSSSYMIKMEGSSVSTGSTCCGRSERCETSPCSTGESCHRK